ncbi:MAG: hypothetical protein IJX67_01880 [Oscillospiraceae bacterium]|nr:hypothetical protein [Clostridia bacterium]MBQ9167143.1 hypothetical protein [Oscillospiraceae bacterium]
MKQLIAFILCFAVSISAAGAEEWFSVADMPVPDRWTATYDTSWRTISVDVQPTIPDVEEISILHVRPAYWIPEPDGETAWSAKDIHFDKGGDAFELTCGDFGKEYDLVRGKRDVVNHSYYVYGPFDANSSYAPENSLTLVQMLSHFDSILAETAAWKPDFDTQHIQSIRTNTYKNKKTGEVLLPAYMAVTLPQALEGVPLWGHIITSVDRHQDNEFFYDPNVSFTMLNFETYQMFGRVVKPYAVLSSDVPLCSFAKVQEALESEIEAGHIRMIYSVDLGYALYNEPGVTRVSGREWIKSAMFYVKPVWRCVCIYEEKASKELSDNIFTDPIVSVYYKTLYVDAQTGILIDPLDARQGCGDYNGYITWEAAQ